MTTMVGAETAAGTDRSVIDVLLRSEEPALRWKVRAGLLGDSPGSPSMRALGSAVRSSERVRTLLSRQGADGRLDTGRNVYAKWQGAHWVLATLADLGYPAGDRTLEPMRDQVQAAWLEPVFFREVELGRKADAYKHDAVPIMCGRYRRCASQQGNALLATVRLGLMDEQTPRLVERLLHWQWPDGGWNCDRDPAADSSSFMETLLPMRGLAAYAAVTGNTDARDAARRAAEVFLERRLFRRRSDHRVIRTEFTKLHYPLYWHYDILGGLLGMLEVGTLGDPRCVEALDLLASKRLADGGWPAEARHYRVSPKVALGNESVDWGGTSIRVMNPWVTVDALVVMAASGRLKVPPRPQRPSSWSTGA